MASEFSRASLEQPDLISPRRDLFNLTQCRLGRFHFPDIRTLRVCADPLYQLDLRRRMAPDNARAVRTGDYARPPHRISLPSINSESDGGAARDGSGCSFESECALPGACASSHCDSHSGLCRTRSVERDRGRRNAAGSVARDAAAGKQDGADKTAKGRQREGVGPRM
jgi:hypothetical protein